MISGSVYAKVKTTCLRKRILGFLPLVRGPRQGSPSKRTAGGEMTVGSPIVYYPTDIPANVPTFDITSP